MQFYTDPSRESDPYALPNAEVFHTRDWSDPDELEEGWYWWPCFPGCDPIGPFETEAEAIADAQEES